METRAHHLLIGTFVLILIGLTVGFAIWLAKLDIDRDVKLYDIFFTEAVSGLSVGNSVRFNGVPVGEVKRIELDPEDPSRVRVRVEIASAVPLKEDSVALLEAVGFTGVAFVQIEGGSARSQPLTKREGEEYAVIPSRPSAIQEVFEGAPDLLNQATIAVSRLSLLLNEENRAEVSGILKNVNKLTGSFSDRTEEMENIILNLNETIAQFREAAQTINRLSATTEGVIDEDLRSTLQEAQRTFSTVEALAVDLRGVVAENRNNLRQFTGSALPEATRLIADIRALAASLSAVAERLEERPAELIFPEKVPEYEKQ
ncbi:MAG: MlaD family protein [Sphingomonadales bacterium]|jgi:phospholipid/cholesterol/gamma-HCH transport system substrate-binding protein